MPMHDWDAGDRCKFRPVFTLPAAVRGHFQYRSPYYYTATVKGVQRTRFGTVALVELDDHTRLPIAPCDRVQAVSLSALHPVVCRCRACRKVPHNRRAWAPTTRAVRWCGRLLAWTWRPLGSTKPTAAPDGK
jgi:hypothetical protein